MSLESFMEILDINTNTEGRALWNLIANRRVFYNDSIEVLTSTFRTNAAVIAKRCGGDYLDYYCSSASQIELDKIHEKFMDHLVSTRGIEIAP